SLEYVPGDRVYFRFVIAEAKADAMGNLNAELNLRLANSDGKLLLNQSFPLEGNMVFGGGVVPSNAQILLYDGIEPGDYSLTVTVTDHVTKAKASFDRKFKVLPKDFAITAVQFSHDKLGKVPAPAGGIVSQTLFTNFRAVGFDNSKGEIDIKMEAHILD